MVNHLYRKISLKLQPLEQKWVKQKRAFNESLFKAGYQLTAGFMETSRRIRDLVHPLPDGVKVESFYYNSPHNPMHQGNVYTPLLRDIKAVIIDIHGGCWNHGDKDVYHHYSYDLAKRGFQVLSLTYSLGTEITQKEQVQDVFAFLHYVQNNAASLHLAKTPIVLTGDSAGAQLALLSMYINQQESMQHLFHVKPFVLNIGALVLMHPVCFVKQALHFPRFPWLSNTVLTPGLMKELYGARWEQSELLKKSDPANFHWKSFHLPPVLIVTSKGDRFFQSQSHRLASLLEKHRVAFELFDEKDSRAVHTYHICNPETDLSRTANTHIENFILKSLRTQAA